MMSKSLLQRITAVGGLLVLASVSLWAAATALTPVQLKLNNYSVQAGDLTIPFTACDTVNGNSYTAVGSEILLVQNTDSSTHTFTVTSVADPYGRTDSSLTTYTVAVSPAIVGVQMKQLQGWVGPGNAIGLTCSSALLKFAVLRTY